MEIRNKNYNQNFKAGLNQLIKTEEKIANPILTEQLFNDSFGIETSLKNNRSAAFANLTCISVLSDIAKKIKLRFFQPPALTIFSKNNLINNNFADNFCIPDTMDVLKGDYPFPGRSIFFRDFKNLQEIDDNIETLYSKKISSSNHFLAPFIHEWLHCIHLDMIYSKLGYGGNCSYLSEVYPNKNTKITGVELIKQLETKTLTQKENDIVFDNLGEYSTRSENQYLEIFAETYTKFICQALDKNCKLVKNPFDILKTTSKDFQTIIHKVCSITELLKDNKKQHL